MIPIHPTGFKYEELVPSDAFFGSAWDLSKKGFKGVVLSPDGDWTKYLFPLIYSHQAPLDFETSACVSHGSMNAIELLTNRIHGQLLDWSDRFVAKGSGTSPAGGNTPKAVCDFIRNSWSVKEEDWPTKAARTQAEFYAEIPRELYDKALKYKTYKFGYERLNPDTATLKEALKYSPIGISCILTRDSNGEIYKPDGFRDGHWLVLLKIQDDGKFVLLDSYGPDFVKISKPFLPEIAMKYAIDYEEYDLLSQVVAKLKQLIAALFPPTPPKTPIPTPVNEPFTTPKVALLNGMCLAIREMEGWFTPSPKNPKGSRSWRNLNPGNTKYSTKGYLAKYEPVKKDKDGFAIFKDYETGWLYLKNLVLQKAKDHPDWDLLDFCSYWAPAADNNNPVQYSEFVAKRMGVTTVWRLKNLL